MKTIKIIEDGKETIWEEWTTTNMLKCLEAENFCRIGHRSYIRQKPAEVFPIVFEDRFYKISVYEGGALEIKRKDGSNIYYFSDSTPLLKQAIAKSDEIRGAGK